MAGEPRLSTASQLTAGVSREQIDEFITLPFHGRGARIIVPCLRTPSFTVPPQRPLILRTPQLRPDHIPPICKTQRGKEGAKNCDPPHPRLAGHPGIDFSNSCLLTQIQHTSHSGQESPTVNELHLKERSAISQPKPYL